MAALNLTKDEIKQVTGRVRASYQVKVLQALGIPVKVRPDGSPLVCRSAYYTVMTPTDKLKSCNDDNVNIDVIALKDFCNGKRKKSR